MLRQEPAGDHRRGTGIFDDRRLGPAGFFASEVALGRRTARLAGTLLLMRIDYHRTLVADVVRNRAFHAALAAVIEPGVSVVADIGAGTGLLGMMAARLGAREVFLYETAEVAGIAAEIIRRNRLRNCHLMPCHSTEMQDPPRVDVVVSETLGNYPFEEDIIETLADARARFLRPGGVMIPGGLRQFVAPVVSDRFHRELSVWDEVADRLGTTPRLALDLSPAKVLSFNNVYVRSIAPADLLEDGARVVEWDSIDFHVRNRTSRHGEASWKLQRAVTIHGFATWWSASLTDCVMLSTAPDAARTHWEQLYFPLSTPVSAQPGETVSVSLRSRSSREAGTHLAWTATHAGRNGRQLSRQAHDLDKGYLP